MSFEATLALARELNQVTYDPGLQGEELREAVRGVLELATDEEVRNDPPGMSELRRLAWRAGFEQAMTDIIDVIAEEFGVATQTEITQEMNGDGGERR